MSDALLVAVGSPVSEGLENFLLYGLPPLISTFIFSLIIIGFRLKTLLVPIIIFLAISLLSNFAVIALYKNYNIVKR